MVGLGDLAVATSTRFEVWFREAFNETVAVVKARLGRLMAKIEMADFEGDRVQIDWIGGVPGLRQWIDEKRAQELLPHNWTVVVKDWEGTVRFKLNTLSDSRGNLYEPRIRGMAINAARHPSKAVSELIRLGDTTVCYDGQYYFDTDHLEGNSGIQSNKLTGTGTSLAQVRTDYFAAKSALMQFVDDQGEEIWMGDFRPEDICFALERVPARAPATRRNMPPFEISGAVTALSENPTPPFAARNHSRSWGKCTSAASPLPPRRIGICNLHFAIYNSQFRPDS